MKRFIAILILAMALSLILTGCISQTQNKCDYGNTSKKYFSNSTEQCKAIRFLCIEGYTYFNDECGCGCEPANATMSNVTENQTATPAADETGNVTAGKNFCSDESRKAQACYELYSPVCGWFNESINCIKYPCAATYSNSCFACKDAKVDFWTEGECPK